MRVKVSFKSLKDDEFSSTFPGVIYKPRKNILRVKVPQKYRAKRVKLKLRTIDREKEKEKNVKIFSTEYEETEKYVIFKYKVSFGLISFNYNRSRVVLDVKLVGSTSKKVVFTSNPFMVLSRVKDEDVFFNRPKKKKKAPKRKRKIKSSCEEDLSDEEERIRREGIVVDEMGFIIDGAEPASTSEDEEEKKITGKKRKRIDDVKDSPETKKQKTEDD